ncbi:MAG: hypothetical protein ABIP30_02595 [Ferruginibacter sp.]
MEMSSVIISIKKYCLKGCMAMLLLLLTAPLHAQPGTKEYTISKGDMKITLSKSLKEKDLDNFIDQYNLGDLALKKMISSNFQDSVKKMGWKIEVNSSTILVLTKPFLSADIFNGPSKTIDLSWINSAAAAMQMPINRPYGYNVFRNKHAFTVKDSVVTFVLHNHKNAMQVKLAGSFTNWEGNAIPMFNSDSGWVVSIKLSPGKYSYKFIIDGNWITDPENKTAENDGEGNTNSVYYATNTIFKLNGFTKAKKVILAGSFDNWDEGRLQMNKAVTGWELPIYLNNGVYTYRFIADGNWMTDPDNANRFPNEHNDFNSVLTIGPPTTFTLNSHKDAKEVFLAGSFNQWRSYEVRMKRTDSGWQIPYVLGPGNYEYKFFIDGHSFDAMGKESRPDAPGSVIVIGANYTFHLKNKSAAKTVFLAGDFNGWSPNAYPMKKDGDEWTLTLHLYPGKHLYKMIIDGNWIIDPGNKLWEDNEYGTGNSVLWVK